MNNIKYKTLMSNLANTFAIIEKNSDIHSCNSYDSDENNYGEHIISYIDDNYFSDGDMRDDDDIRDYKADLIGSSSPIKVKKMSIKK